jgi:hypothetical protein
LYNSSSFPIKVEQLFKGFPDYGKLRGCKVEKDRLIEDLKKALLMCGYSAKVSEQILKWYS